MISREAAEQAAKRAVNDLFVMDYDNIPDKGPLMLFRKLDDGTMTLATPDHIVEFARSILQKCDKLQSFKDWVHAYLDGKGIPHHPPGVHGAEGCRIGDRMDYVFERFHHDTGMAKVTIEIVDKEDGGIDLTVNIDPPPVKGQPLTAAQSTGMAFVEGATELKDNPT